MAFSLERNKTLYEQLVAKYPECPALWKYFVMITEVPRPSGATQRVSEWAADIGRKVGGTVKTDAAGNVSIAIPATPFVTSIPFLLCTGFCASGFPPPAFRRFFFEKRFFKKKIILTA